MSFPWGLEAMDRSVLETCRAELQRQLDEPLAGAEKTVSDMTSVSEENFPDPTDRALLESNRNFTLRLRDRDRKLLVKIQEAIKRIENGMFGICDDHTVRAARPRPRLEDGWDAPAWAGAAPLEIACFRPEGSGHRPRTRARLAFDDEGLSGLFRVEDRYVRSVHTRFGEPVYRDSCVEIFLLPKPDRGYLNFEMNAGGALLASHVTDHRRTPEGFAAFTRLTEEDGRQVAVRSSLPPVVEPEIEGPVDWQMAFSIPVTLLETYVGPIGTLAGQEWRANLYKCGDRTSHPHWACWSPVDALNFHLPHCFGTLLFL